PPLDRLQRPPGRPAIRTRSRQPFEPGRLRGGAAAVRRVMLVGIGPGNPALLTVKAAETIRGADVIRHPPGVDVAILGLARPGALIAPLSGYDEILHLAKHDHRVAVLFRGDPFAFGDGKELAEALQAAGL